MSIWRDVEPPSSLRSLPPEGAARRRTGGAGSVAGGLVAAIGAWVLTAAASTTAAQDSFPGIGRTATPAEVATWDIDVRPDFKGLPKGSGSVARGQQLWEAQCASCHGVFGESNQFFSPLIGGTTPEDVKTGRTARLNDPAYPGRSTLMKLSTLSTLWDYIHRAMPWTNPKSLSADEVYALTAFLLNLGGVVADDFVLSDGNIAQVQQRLPNRKGMSTAHALWPGKGLGPATAPDVRASACMRNCVAEVQIASHLPDFARNQHGNLAEQNRSVGAQRGVDTTRLPGVATADAVAATATPAGANLAALLQKHNCSACHGIANKIVGPALRDIAARYASRHDAAAHFAARIKAGSQGIWGAIPMPPQNLPDNDLKAIAQWLAAGASP